MTKDEALKLALEALEEHDYGVAQIIIREALAQQEQEPVGEIVDAIEGAFKCSFTKMLPVGAKLYTTPPQRKPLTDEEIDRLWSQSLADTEGETYLPLREFARAIEAKLKEKNT